MFNIPAKVFGAHSESSSLGAVEPFFFCLTMAQEARSSPARHKIERIANVTTGRQLLMYAAPESVRQTAVYWSSGAKVKVKTVSNLIGTPLRVAGL
jgi:hypothetical protein